MRALVTGAAGFVGRHLVNRLAREGHEVRALIRPGGRELGGATSDPNVDSIQADVRDAEALERAARGCSVVFHLAARTALHHVPRRTFDAVNVEGTTCVARAALRAGAERLVHCSTTSVYGAAIRDHRIDERTPPRPDTPYGASKLRAERALWSLREGEGLPVVVVRLTTLLGPGAHSWRGFFRDLERGGFRPFGRGDNHHHLTDVADAVQGLVRAARVPAAEGRTYVIAAAAATRLRTFVELAGREVGAAWPDDRLPLWPLRLYGWLDRAAWRCSGRRLPRADRVEFFLGDRVFQIDRAMSELGYRPRVGIERAVARTAAWLREGDGPREGTGLPPAGAGMAAPGRSAAP